LDGEMLVSEKARRTVGERRLRRGRDGRSCGVTTGVPSGELGWREVQASR